MARVQLALNVSNLAEAIEFYSKLFGAAPAKVREGYANFAIADPPLKLVLLENAGTPGTMNHLGVEVESTALVTEAIARLQNDGLETTVEEETTCCFAVQDKVWVNAPDGEPWEVYTVLADAPTMKLIPVATADGAACCAPATDAAVADSGSCCG